MLVILCLIPVGRRYEKTDDRGVVYSIWYILFFVNQYEWGFEKGKKLKVLNKKKKVSGKLIKRLKWLV